MNTIHPTGVASGMTQNDAMAALDGAGRRRGRERDIGHAERASAADPSTRGHRERRRVPRLPDQAEFITGIQWPLEVSLGVMKPLTNTVAVITGGASSIGRGTAQSLSRRGAAVVIADVNVDGARTVADEIATAGGQSAAMACDVTGDSAFDELRDFVIDRFGRVDIVMNNVGVLASGQPDHIPVHEWQRIIDVNLMSVVRSNTAFLPMLIEQGHGHVVNTASFAGLFTYSYDRLPYAATKAAIVRIFRKGCGSICSRRASGSRCCVRARCSPTSWRPCHPRSAPTSRHGPRAINTAC